ncbi:MAG: hypothetical protein IKP50_00535 [Bacilli bacterium]|nr:hypothetical protein [Bacilli bacterium]
MVADVPEKVKALFEQDSIRKNFRVQVLEEYNGEMQVDYTLVNSDIVSESVVLTESISSSTPIKFGLSENASLEFKTFSDINITGKQIRAYIEIDITSIPYSEVHGQTTSDVPYRYYRIPYGTFYVDSCKKDANTDIRTVIAYRSKKTELYPSFDKKEETQIQQLLSSFFMHSTKEFTDFKNVRLKFFPFLMKVDSGNTKWLDTIGISYSTNSPNLRLIENWPEFYINTDLKYVGPSPSPSTSSDDDIIIIEDLDLPLGVEYDFFLKTWTITSVNNFLGITRNIGDEPTNYSGNSQTVSNTEKFNPNNFYRIDWEEPNTHYFRQSTGYDLKFDAYMSIKSNLTNRIVEDQAHIDYRDRNYNSKVGIVGYSRKIPSPSGGDYYLKGVNFCPCIDGMHDYLSYANYLQNCDIELHIPIGIDVKKTTIYSGAAITSWQYYSFYENGDPYIGIGEYQLPDLNYYINIPVKQASANNSDGSSAYEYTMDTSNLISSGEVLIQFFEINGYFLQKDRIYNKWVMKRVQHADSLYPANNLYPSNSLYPAEATALIATNLCKSAWFDDNITCPYDIVEYAYNDNYFKANIVDDVPEEGEDNTYVHYTISDNKFLEACCTDNRLFANVQAILDSMANKLKQIYYYKTNIQMRALPYIEAGDDLLVLTKNDGITTFALKHRISGVQCLMDSIEAN